MNYINQIRGFWTSHEEHSFSTTEIALYFHLLEVCNICQWKNPFKRNNQRIQADLGLSFNTLKNARNKLKTCGLIEVSTQNGNPNTLYTLSKFDEVFTRLERGSHEVSAEVLPTKDKQNKTKLKNTLSTEKKEASEKTWKNDFEIYLSELNKESARLLADKEWISQQEGFNPRVNIQKSIEKSCANYWGTEAGWKKKRGAKITTIDWRGTFANAVSLQTNRVYKDDKTVKGSQSVNDIWKKRSKN